MSAYVLANVDVQNAEDYQEYVRRNTAVVQQYGGQFVVRGGKCEVLEGSWTTSRLVLIEFPSADAARSWYNSPEYREILPIRQRNAITRQLVILYSA